MKLGLIDKKVANTRMHWLQKKKTKVKDYFFKASLISVNNLSVLEGSGG